MKKPKSQSKISWLVEQAKSLQVCLKEDIRNSKSEREEKSFKASIFNSQCSSNRTKIKCR